MRPKSFLILAFLLISKIGYTQITIQFNGINEYAFNTAQAMNLTVINVNTKAFEVQFSGKITSGNGAMVVEFKSNPVLLNPGANMLNPMNPGIHEQIYHNSDIAEIEAKTGTYPSGNYTICIWSACTVSDCQGAGQGSGSIETPVCTQVHVENPTPLLLASPGNGSEIEETRPIYTWIPPGPVSGSANLNYTMVLVEILDGQSISDALTLNRPLINMMGIGNPMLMHPSDIAALEAGKSYAWQVQAYVGNVPIAKSEQWKFKVKKEEKKKNPVGNMYVVLKTDDKDIHHVIDTLKVVYKETKTKDQLTFIFKNEAGEQILVDNSKTSVYGENPYIFDLLDPRFAAGKLYYLILVNASSQKFTLKFTIIK